MNIRAGRFALLLIVCAAVIAASGCGKSKKVELRYTFKKGQTFNMRMTADQKISQTIMGTKQDMDQRIVLGMRFDVKDVAADGVATVKTTYDRASLRQSGPMGTTEYDSSKPDGNVPVAAQGFAALVGQGFVIKWAPDGQVKDVEGLDSMLRNVMRKIDVPSPQLRPIVEKQLKEQFGEKAMKENMQAASAIFPDRPVAIGDSWQRSFIVTKGFPVIVDSTWTLKELKDGVAIIDAVSTIKPNPEAKPVEMGAMKLSMRFSGKQSGTMKVDRATGFVLSGKVKQDMSGKASMRGVEQSMSWPMDVKGTIRITSTKGK